MSIYLISGADDEPSFASSNKGWSEFGDWASVGQLREAQHLFDHGWNEPAGELLAELKASERPHDPNVAAVLDTVIEFLESVATDAPVVVSAGMMPDDKKSD